MTDLQRPQSNSKVSAEASPEQPDRAAVPAPATVRKTIRDVKQGETLLIKEDGRDVHIGVALNSPPRAGDPRLIRWIRGVRPDRTPFKAAFRADDEVDVVLPLAASDLS
ncbi:hypothetical protein [Nocardia sp. NPDC056100]|uniref:hypothetical protein n=1 Tax=Nocardia sp. NPDC056100 TaxID=3345712 RepID=UPI0035D65B49